MGVSRVFQDYCRTNNLPHEVILRQLDRSYEEDQAILKDILNEWDKKYAHQKIGVFLANDTTANTLLNLIIRRVRLPAQGILQSSALTTRPPPERPSSP